MKKYLIIFIPFILFAKFYSIQLYTANKNAINSVINFYNKLPEKIKHLSVIYKTDRGFLTVRYLVATKIKNLKPYAKNLKHYSFVTDDETKIKKLFLDKFKTDKSTSLKKLLITMKWLKITKQPKSTTKKKTKKPSAARKSKSKTKYPDWVKMAIALHNYDKEKITKLLNTNIDYYQKIEAYDKLQRYNDLTEIIYRNYNSNLADAYLEAVKKINSSYKITSSIKKHPGYTNYYNIFQFSQYYNVFKFEFNRVLNINSKKMSFSNQNINVSFEKTGTHSLISLLYKKNMNKLSILLGINQNVYGSDSYYINYKKHSIGFSYEYLYNLTFDLSFERFETFSNRFFLNKEKLQINHRYIINSQLYNGEYLKIIKYSNTLKSYLEIGNNINYGNENNFLKVFKPFASLNVYYNTQTNFGISVKTGINRSLFKADNFKTYVKYYKNRLTNEKGIEFLLSYICFF